MVPLRLRLAPPTRSPLPGKPRRARPSTRSPPTRPKLPLLRPTRRPGRAAAVVVVAAQFSGEEWTARRQRSGALLVAIRSRAPSLDSLGPSPVK